jgi:hypothetical protein
MLHLGPPGTPQNFVEQSALRFHSAAGPISRVFLARMSSRGGERRTER